MSNNSSAAIAAVAKAHDDGTLFAHMFEFDEGAPHQLEALCNVLHGKPGTHFSNLYHTVEAAPDGYHGLATTAMKKGLPVSLWSFNDGVGIVMDGNDETHIKPVHVSSVDSWTRAEDNCLKFVNCEPAAFKELADMQDLRLDGSRYAIPENGSSVINFADPELPVQINLARAALKRFWEILKPMDWNEYIAEHPGGEKGINEVNLIAHLQGIKGLIVSETMHHSSSDASKSRKFAMRIEYAKATRDQMETLYPDVFPAGSLPIFSYDPARSEGQLVALSEEQLAQPHKYFMQRHPPVTDRFLS